MPLPVDDPIVVAPSPTPFKEDDSVDHAAIERNVARWLDTPLSGFVLNSENGEEAFLSEQEQLDIVRTVDGARTGKKFIVGGVDNPSVTESLRIAEALVRAGAELIRVRVPRLTSNVRDYFEQVVPRAAAPVIIIHQMAPGQFMGGSAPIGAPAETLGELAAMENVFGYIASGNIRFESRVRAFVPKDKRFWVSNGLLLLPGAAIGANGACLMFGNVSPRDCLDIIRLVMAGELAQAQQIQSRIVEADWQILSRGAAGIKAALNLLRYDGTSPRSPAPPCTVAEVAQIRVAMEKARLL